MKPTIITLWGSSGTGKTALKRLCEAGLAGLVDVPILREAMTAGFASIPDATSAEWRRAAIAGNAVPSYAPTIEAALAGREYLLDDCTMQYGKMVHECGSTYRIVILCIFAYPWLVAARRQVRYRRTPCDRARAETEGWLPDLPLLDHVRDHWLQEPRVETVIVDASDYPIRQITIEDGYALVNAVPHEVTLPPVNTMYQQTVWIAGEPHGNLSAWRMAFERARLDSILPARLDGLTILDIGASEGGMCYEAVNRGAVYATAIESRPEQCAIMREVRTACQLPLTVCEMDIATQDIPPQMFHASQTRYDVGLLLNVLHHFHEPRSILDKVLAACERVIVETPFGIGLQPYQPGIDPYPNATAIPPHWIDAVARESGFLLRTIRLSTMTPGQRLIYELERMI